jgi:Fumarate reductase subunit D
MKRSDEPVYWLLFGAGGVVAAVLLPVMILITGLLVPLGILNADTLSYEKCMRWRHPGGVPPSC